ncbi:MAG: 3-dehydroquinate synthase [Bacteroidales bacterium]|nr:3-dehydroquinate synthase [Bacteroidales bacterium]
MQTLKIHSSIGDSTIYVGESFKNVAKYIPNTKVAIITDSTVKKLYGHSFPHAEVVITLEPGEAHKTIQSLDVIFEHLVEHEFDRSSFILAIGGGIVCDIAGFAASIFMRGIAFGFISTTLLSQVDASVGGKNGVNFRGYKNMIGSFNLPSFVICDPNMLTSLGNENILCGMGEVVKHGAIAYASLFEYIENNIEQVKARNPEVFARFVHDSVVIKSNIVNKDAKEKGERRKLNFGHTFAHAFEKIQKIPHGMAVSIGMVIAAKISEKRGLLAHSEVERLINLLQALSMPTEINLLPEELFSVLKRDKKREGEAIHFVMLTAIGTSVVEKISLSELNRIIYDLY